MITKGQLVLINTMVSKLKISKDIKKIMVSGFTNGRETSTANLTKTEAAEMIRHLKALDPQEKESEKLRRTIISLAHELGWKRADSSADMRRIDEWCMKYGKYHKKLNQHSYNELVELVTIFKKVRNDFLQAI